MDHPVFSGYCLESDAKIGKIWLIRRLLGFFLQHGPAPVNCAYYVVITDDKA
jgi:hypothetical protein